MHEQFGASFAPESISEKNTRWPKIGLAANDGKSAETKQAYGNGRSWHRIRNPDCVLNARIVDPGQIAEIPVYLSRVGRFSGRRDDIRPDSFRGPLFGRSCLILVHSEGNP